MITNEPVRGSIPPPWFWALSGVERMQALSQGHVPAPPLTRLTGVRPAHVGPGSGTWIMPASPQIQGAGTLEITPLVGAALEGIAMSVHPPGTTVDLLTIDVQHLRRTRPHAGNLSARGRVVNASKFFTYTEVQIEDTEGRQIALANSYAAIRQIDPPPPPAPEPLQPVEEPSYATPDPHARPVVGSQLSRETWDTDDGMALAQQFLGEDAPADYMSLVDLKFLEVNSQQVVAMAPANGWLCLFSQFVSRASLASYLYDAMWIAAITTKQRGESFAGFTQHAHFYRDVPADGRSLRIETHSLLREENLLTGHTRLLDADGRLVAALMGRGTFLDASERQQSAAAPAQRVLCTLLFTDIVASTQHAERLGDGKWRSLLDDHHMTVRREITRCGGTEIDTAGDGFFVRFDGPAHAIECARAVRNGVRALGIEIRAGVHTGECEMHGRSLAGMAVHIGARIESAADPGEILVSGTVKDLVVGSGTRFEDRGEHTLKGVPDTWRLYAVAD